MSSPRLWAMRTAFRAVGAVAPGVAARWAETLFCTPPRRAGGDASFLASGTPFAVESQGQRLAAGEWGAGPTVVLAHGWGSRRYSEEEFRRLPWVSKRSSKEKPPPTV